MDELVLPGEPQVRVALNRSARARRLSLRVSRLDGRVTLTLPRRVPLRDAIDFVQSREGWLRGHLAGVAPPERPRFGDRIPLRGADVTLVPGPGRVTRLQGDTLVLPADPERVCPRLHAWLRGQARDDLARAADRHAAALGLPYRSLTLRDTRSRWGSCSSRGDLMFSWRLVLAPAEILDYVAAHEVAHLVCMDHSPAFWAVVERLFPGHAPARAWLRREGDQLHRLRLTD